MNIVMQFRKVGVRNTYHYTFGKFVTEPTFPPVFGSPPPVFASTSVFRRIVERFRFDYHYRYRK